jgi:hypothetical protein
VTPERRRFLLELLDWAITIGLLAIAVGGIIGAKVLTWRVP